jgi:hypothetical protein
MIEGLAAEKVFNASEEHPEPSPEGISEDEYYLRKIINDSLKEDKTYFSKLTADLKGIS